MQFGSNLIIISSIESKANKGIFYRPKSSFQELYAEKATSIIESHDTDTPLFLYVALQNVHGPQQATTELKSLYRGVTPTKRKITSGNY